MRHGGRGDASITESSPNPINAVDVASRVDYARAGHKVTLTLHPRAVPPSRGGLALALLHRRMTSSGRLS
jgi:hypothetical protein